MQDYSYRQLVADRVRALRDEADRERVPRPQKRRSKGGAARSPISAIVETVAGLVG